jgi:hypothetical protein
MSLEELREQFDAYFNPDPDEFERSTGDYPHDRITQVHGLDQSYLESLDWDGSSGHWNTRHCAEQADWLLPLTRNLDVPLRLLETAMRLFADSILVYHDRTDRKGELHYYPPVILTFWSGFETFVRLSGEIMLNTVKGVPPEVSNYLRELETYSDATGEVRTRERYQGVLNRYAVLLRHGYEYKVDRGSKHWQRLAGAKALRDYYSHINVGEPRALTSTEVLDFMEAVMIGIIWPSTELKRTQLLGIYRLYSTLDMLREATEDYTERPFFKDWKLNSRSLAFHCPFENVDIDKFPNSDGKYGRPSRRPES